MTLDKRYQPNEIEQKIYQSWEQEGYFKPTGQGESYCIVLPPPNVTGTLHMGHGFQVTLMDALIRYQRMKGKATHWQMGTDHAGIATQMVVERRLLNKNITRHDLGREAFVKRVWKWKAKSGGNIKNQLKRMGASGDWTQERFSMDEGISNAVRKVFVTLYKEGLIYRGKRLVNWDPVLLTAISDLEVASEETDGHLWYINYPLLQNSGHITVATTRPETMLGDTAVAVNPDDDRYRHWIGKTIELPLTKRHIPIIADPEVDMEFGTGCVKITPAHDFNDYAMGKRHGLPLINILTPDARINDNAPKKYQGLDRYEARKNIIDDLEELKLLEKIERRKICIPKGDRSGAVIEPYLTDQWFIKAKPLADPAIAAVKKGEIRFVPENWSKTYYQWLENIEDWCISRQLWWGHRIPAWYDDNGNVYVGDNEAAVREHHNLSDSVSLHQDSDVLDTWFSASLWPFTTLGWPEKTHNLQTFYPTNVLVTGFDIIFFWVARMIMMSLKFIGKVPFREVYITGLIRDKDGQKMSKSKGNVLDPIDLVDGIELEPLIKKRIKGLMQPKLKKNIEIETRAEFPNGIAAHGTDAVRFTYCALASTGRDIRFDLGRLEGYRNFCNKLWNAARYVLMNTQEQPLSTATESAEYNVADEWIRSRLQHTIQQVQQAFDQYRFDYAAQAIYEFTWNEYCDWYLELSKPVLTNPESSTALLLGTRLTLLQVLEQLLRLSHPIIPFISEEIWQQIAPLLEIKQKSIMNSQYPEVDKAQLNPTAEKEIVWLQKMVISIRNIRGEMNISPNKPIPLILTKGTSDDQQCLNKHQAMLLTLAKLSKIEWLPTDQAQPASATAIVGELELLIPIADLIDQQAEINRLSKEIEKLEKDLQKSQQKLDNPNYIKKAPQEIVDKERDRMQSLDSKLSKLKKQLTNIQNIKTKTKETTG